MNYKRRKIRFTSTGYYSYIFLLLFSFFIYNCKSSRTTSYNRREIQELEEDEYFDDDDSGVSKKHKGEKRVEKDNVKKVIKSARSYIGTPYRYGGTTRSGMDCSGLLVCCFRTVDITLPRTSAEQSKYGKEIDLEDLQEGDLVFFSERKGGRRVSHVGMVTEVRGRKDVKFIHASTSLGVVENDLYAPYFIKIFVKAVRPF